MGYPDPASRATELTTAADLRLTTGVARRLVARIEGLNYDFWQPSNRAASPLAGVNGWRTPLDCLDVDAEASSGLDLRKMAVDVSGLTLYLSNTYDANGNWTHATNNPDTSYLLAQQFAPARTPPQNRCYLRRNSETDAWVLPLPSSGYIHVDVDPSDRGFASSGVAYLNGEPFSYTSIDTTTNFAGQTIGRFKGVVRGLYPAVGASGVARAYPILSEGSSTFGTSITPYPDSLFGRLVVLYAATLQSDGTWSAFSDAEPLWSGYLDHQVNYDAAEGRFELACFSLVNGLEDRSAARELPTGLLRGINLSGTNTDQRTLRISVGAFSKEFTVDAAHYATPLELAQEVVSKAKLAFFPNSLSVYATDRGLEFSTYSSTTTELSGRFTHTGRALGLPDADTSTLSFVRNSPGAVVPWESYHPGEPGANGGNLYTGLDRVITKQGDTTTTQAFVSLSRVFAYDANGQQVEIEDSRAGVLAYTGSSGRQRILSLTADAMREIGWWAGHRVGEEPCEVKNCLFMTTTDVYGSEELTSLSDGPFSFLLRCLVSTGGTTGAHNGTYDTMAPEFSLGVPADLVDTQGFLDADAAIAGDALTGRWYQASIDTTSWLEILQRECMLFGYALAFTRGKLRLLRVVEDLYVETLDAGTNAEFLETSVVESDARSTITAWDVRAFQDASKGELSKRKIEISDAAARELSTRHEIKLEHPGIGRWESHPLGPFFASDTQLSSALVGHFSLGWSSMLRYALQKVQVSLAPEMAIRIGIGDAVRYQNENHPSPDGSGAMSVDRLGIVTNIAWSYAGENAWTGQATILLYSGASPLDAHPWAPGALVDNAGSEGWSGTPGFYLAVEQFAFGDSTIDSEDGEAFVAGDEILVIHTHTTDPTSPSVQGPFTVSGYDAANNRLYLSGSPSISLVSDSEYVVVPADYTDIGGAQRLRASHQASATTHALDGDNPDIYA
jgi:hypothetical protein